MIQVNWISVLVFFCGLMSLSIGIYAWLNRPTKGAHVFAFVMLALSIYILGYGFELSSTSLDQILFWNRLEYIGILSFPTLVLVFDIQYTENDKWLTRKNLFLLFVFPAVLFIIKCFDGSLHLIYSYISLDTTDLIPLLAITPGPLYILMVIYNLSVVTIGNYILIKKRQNASALFRSQSAIILGAALIIYVTYFYYLTGIPIYPRLKHLDINPIVFIIWGCVIFWAIFRYRLFDLAPVARETLIEVLKEGVVVLDSQYRIVDVNPEATLIFNWEKMPLGLSMIEVLEGKIDPTALANLQDSFNVEIRLIRGDTARYYDVTISHLKDRKGGKIGYLMVFQDVSKRKEYETRLQEISLMDDLTGINNRRGFNMMATQLLNMALRMHSNAILIYIDMDRLKWINDHFGHSTGDQALIDTGFILKNAFRSSDIIARYGGDEFTILAAESADNTAANMILRLQDQIDEYNHKNQRTFKLSLSYGVSHYHWKRPQTLEELLEEADHTMYLQKQGKRELTA